jgi:endogenous inhibitor of DNA gyrase (YacG/DUF329 family)
MAIINPTVTKNQLKSEVLRIAKMLNKTPTRSEYRKYRTLVGGSHQAISVLFGKNAWNSLLTYCELPLVMNTPSETIKMQQVKCENCKKDFNKRASEIARTNNNFCSSRCAAIHRNKNKTTGTRVSKLEKYIQLKLAEAFPLLDIKFNDVSRIKRELDIYIPSLNLAFELDGIFHKLPIYGEHQFNKQKIRDRLKDEECSNLGISLVRVDTSPQKVFTEKSSKVYLDMVVAGIEKLLYTDMKSTT